MAFVSLRLSGDSHLASSGKGSLSSVTEGQSVACIPYGQLDQRTVCTGLEGGQACSADPALCPSGGTTSGSLREFIGSHLVVTFLKPLDLLRKYQKN